MIWLVAQEEKSDNHIMHLFLSNVSTNTTFQIPIFSLNYFKKRQILLGLLDCSINFMCQERLDRFYGLLFSYFCWSLTGWNDSIQRYALNATNHPIIRRSTIPAERECERATAGGGSLARSSSQQP